MKKTILTIATTIISLALLLSPAIAQNSLHDIPGEHTITAYVPSTAAGTDKSYPVVVVPFKSVVVDCKIIFDTAVTGADTNTFTATLLNGGAAGTGTTSVATGAYTNGNDAAALTPETLTNSGTSANLNLAADDVLVYKSDQAGTGLIDPAKVVVVTIKAR